MRSVPEGPPTSATPTRPGRPLAAIDKMRVRFRKGHALRLLGHQDLLRTFERLLRRADLPVHHSRGFHPKPRIIFALSLPLGVIGCAEIVEIELDQQIEPEEVHARMAMQAPLGLDVLDVRRIGPRAAARVRSLCYALSIPLDRHSHLSQRIRDVLAATECCVSRSRTNASRPPRDIRPFLRDLRLSALPPSSEGSTPAQTDLVPTPLPVLEMDLWLSSRGTAHPHEVLSLLELQDLLEAGCLLQRVRLELFEDSPPSVKESHEERNAH